MRLLLFALAEKLGIWDVDALGDAMSSDLLMQWRTFREVKAEIVKQELSRPRPSKGG